jgi:DNA anti-recombination protein RmuC
VANAGEAVAAATAERDAARGLVAKAERTAELAEQSALDVRGEVERVRADLASVRTAGEEELGRVRQETTAQLDEVRRNAAERLASLEEARAQTLTRAERAESQLDWAMAELARVREKPIS